MFSVCKGDKISCVFNNEFSSVNNTCWASLENVSENFISILEFFNVLKIDMLHCFLTFSDKSTVADGKLDKCENSIFVWANT
jgi:hypothetical protein